MIIRNNRKRKNAKKIQLLSFDDSLEVKTPMRRNDANATMTQINTIEIEGDSL